MASLIVMLTIGKELPIVCSYVRAEFCVLRCKPEPPPCHENPESVPPIPITALQNLDLCHTGLQSTRCLILGGTGRGLLREQGLLLEQAYVTAGAGLRVRFGAQPV
eukprot:scaffold120770_cov18-Tisochrysis_lutea.AAC.1